MSTNEKVETYRRSDPVPQLFSRLQMALELENVSLRTRPGAESSEHIVRKNHALLELQRVIAGLSSEELAARAGIHLQELRVVVAENAKLLSRQMGAVREVSEILREAIHLSDSDGTYSAYASSRGPTK